MGCPDDGELQAKAVTRVRRQRLLGLLPVVVLAMFVPIVVLTGDADSPWSAGRVAVLLAPAGIVLVVLAGLYPFMRRQERHTPLSFGADKNTQKAVQRALRTGEPADARIDALARDAATKALRSPWPIRLFAGTIVLMLISAVLQILSGGGALRVGLSVSVVLIFATVLATFVVNRRRSRTYLDR